MTRRIQGTVRGSAHRRLARELPASEGGVRLSPNAVARVLLLFTHMLSQHPRRPVNEPIRKQSRGNYTETVAASRNRSLRVPSSLWAGTTSEEYLADLATSRDSISLDRHSRATRHCRGDLLELEIIGWSCFRDTWCWGSSIRG